jgi:hypothetical protein
MANVRADEVRAVTIFRRNIVDFNILYNWHLDDLTGQSYCNQQGGGNACQESGESDDAVPSPLPFAVGNCQNLPGKIGLPGGFQRQ